MKRIILILFILFIIIYSGTIYYHLKKSLPNGMSIEGDIHQVEDVELLTDLTYKNKQNERIVEHEIVDSMIKEVQNANEFIVIDMFLFNKDTNKDQEYPRLVEKFTEVLIKKKQEMPSIDIVFLTDKINTVYGSYNSEEFNKLKDAGVKVIETDVKALRDSNPLYSGFWRMFGQWVKTGGDGHLPNLLANSAPKVTTLSYLELLNVKANHRKLVITEKSAIISSGNIHNASGYHSNIAFKVNGNIINDLLQSEESTARLNETLNLPRIKIQEESKAEVKIQILTEGKIGKHVLKEIKNTEKSDSIWIGMLYLADRKVMNEIKAAAQREVNIYLVLDPNQNSFGNKKAGLPNIPVVAELRKAQAEKYIHIKWYNTGKEQFHPKIVLIERNSENTIINGSANLTRRNLYDFNLETDIKIMASKNTKVMKDTKAYFQKLWTNDGAEFTKDVDTKSNLPLFRYIIYRLQGFLGFTTY
ncbi:phospholipase D family protein [Cytobacillus oceanisediminis]|uniref:Phospholipase n=1 Tax=Niallia alba TaxID=2729105 RepID=A0A7Y0PMF8_9BACI|nr:MULTISPECIES: phospholipase D family protein [Bacillaceae]MBQ6446198.1 phospholipase D family protein [Bacillus sp. (in: firmicutes)]MBZ9535133.1 phospholipase D family protein [Cytobacillus oceanisediminis]NMO77750.1 phospholipase [Niallia alba]